MFADSFFLKGFAIFVLLNVLLFLIIFQFHNFLPFNKFNYQINSYHYLADNRVIHKNYNLINSLAQYDSQWYLRIAQLGYFHPKNKSDLNAQSYAFFPLYPLLINLTNRLLYNPELTAFLLANILLVINFFSLYYLTKKYYGKNISLKTVFLFFFFPFAIFYRSYYPEGLQLFLLIWFCYFLIKRELFASALFLSFLNICKGNLLLLNLLFWVKIMERYQQKEISLQRSFLLIAISLLPFFCWLIFCYHQTGDPVYFFNIQNYWFPLKKVTPILLNIDRISKFSSQKLHFFHSSQIDILVIIFTLILLIKSYRFLKPELWWVSFFIFITPLLLKDTLSYSRLQIISFPLFIYLAAALPKNIFWILVAGFYTLLILTSLYFVNWYWVG